MDLLWFLIQTVDKNKIIDKLENKNTYLGIL